MMDGINPFRILSRDIKMAIFTRRSFLSFIGAAPFASLAEMKCLAEGQVRTRYDARSAKGIEMLGIYADAVKKMKDRTQFPEGDPRSWLFQWYTHFVNDATTKEAEIARLYPNPADPNRAVAEAMWNTCQAHSGQDEDYFLPWHRCFVYYFEKIIASVSKRPDFTLPYWNYSATDPSIRGIIPPQFTKENDPTFGSLFDGLRNQDVNDGRPIQQNIGAPSDPLSLDALGQENYGSGEVDQGFNMALDLGLHGNVHVGVGGPRNMGNVPTAAQDPIFWLHHCNIDRLWASWNLAGGVNPSLDQTFTFADGNSRAIVVNIADHLDLNKLDYVYDRYEPVPGAIRRPMLAMANLAIDRVADVGQLHAVKLGPTATKIAMKAPANVAAISPLRERVMKAAPGQSIFLVVRQLTAKAQPGVLYNLYLDLPENATPQQLADHFVGTINFFGIFHPGGKHGGVMAKQAPAIGGGKFVSFNVTGKIRALGKSGILGEQPILSIIPSGQPNVAAEPTIGKIELIIR